jgi:hypothetical protein
MKSLLFVFMTVSICMFSSAEGNAFKLDPYSLRDRETGIFQGSHIGDHIAALPIHENLTIKAIAASKIPPTYKTDEFLVNIIKGIRWNDDPLGLWKGREVAFYLSFRDSCSQREPIDPDWDLLYRTHCGDMQFLHSMASSLAEPSIDTQKKILMWLEFTFKVASGTIDKDRHFRSLDQFLDQDAAEEFRRLMTNNGKTRMKWQPEKLLTLDCDRWFTWKALFFRARITELTCKDLNNKFPEQITQDIALGSLLHVIQDSFSASHVLREGSTTSGKSRLTGVGKIIQFGNYLLQDRDRHSIADIEIDEESGNYEFDLTEISAKVIELVIAQRLDKRDKWSEAKHLFRMSFTCLIPLRPLANLGSDSRCIRGLVRLSEGLRELINTGTQSA